ncbi:MAG: choice-of-anchor Q domain-containing protein [Caldilineaceae bacterium]
MKTLLILLIPVTLLFATVRYLQAQDTPLIQYVAPSGSDSGYCTLVEQPCQTINYALSKGLSNVEVRVAAGIYHEPILLYRAPSVVSQPITLTGGFTLTNWITPSWTTNPTILDGQKSYRPLTIQADQVRVDGFIIRHGNANLFDHTGGGIYIGGVNQTVEATLVNLRVENNVASTVDGGEGGGLAAVMGDRFVREAKLTLENVSFISNTASTGHLAAIGGGVSLQAVAGSHLDVAMSQVRIERNRAGNDFSSSGGGLAFNLNGGTATVRNTYILDNASAISPTVLGGPSRGGGIYLLEGNLLLENVLLAGNAGERGDALSIQVQEPLTTTVAMNYVTFANNYRVALDASAAIHSEGNGVNLHLSNTLISGNPTALKAPFNAQAVSLTLVNTLVDTNVTSLTIGKVDQKGTPLRGSAGYRNATAGDYHLAGNSAAIDQGNNLPPLSDLDGVARPNGTASDIGAFEFIAPVLVEQTITFATIADRRLSDLSFVLSATASSGLTVTLESKTTSVCTLAGNRVQLLATGTCTLVATQAGNAQFKPATPVERSFVVLPEESLHELFLPLVLR